MVEVSIASHVNIINPIIKATRVQDIIDVSLEKCRNLDNRHILFNK